MRGGGTELRLLSRSEVVRHYPQDILPCNGRKAFTLAEVLISLGIIGVVAAVTMLNLIANYQKAVTVNQLKAAYSIFSQAVERSIEDNGDIATWELSYSDMAPKYIFPYVETVGTVKKYNIGALSPDSNFIHWGGWVNKGKIYAMKNGMTYSLIYDHDVITLMVDINGTKGPNRVGRDGFAFRLLPKQNKLILAGADKSRSEIIDYYFGGCKKYEQPGAYYSGEFCGALIMIDGWKITSTYPW